MAQNSIGSWEKLSHFEVMEIFSRLSELKDHRVAAVTIGNFDGFHLGHQQLVQSLHKTPLKPGLSLVITFDPHPREILFPSKKVPRLSSWKQLENQLTQAGVKGLLRMEFTPQLKATTAEKFMNDIWASFKFSRLVVGHDFALGAEREGNADFLKSWCQQKNIQFIQVSALKINDQIISSQKIRQCLAEGEVETAKLYLGRAYALDGVVVKGDGRGRQINFPTANLETAPQRMIPKVGVYGSCVHVDGKTYPAVCNVGLRPTFQSQDLTPRVEAFLIDQDLDLYGKKIEIDFEFRIRDEKKFSTVDELKTQIQNDIDLFRKRKGL